MSLVRPFLASRAARHGVDTAALRIRAGRHGQYRDNTNTSMPLDRANTNNRCYGGDAPDVLRALSTADGLMGRNFVEVEEEGGNVEVVIDDHIANNQGEVATVEDGVHIHHLTLVVVVVDVHRIDVHTTLHQSNDQIGRNGQTPPYIESNALSHSWVVVAVGMDHTGY